MDILNALNYSILTYLLGSTTCKTPNSKEYFKTVVLRWLFAV